MDFTKVVRLGTAKTHGGRSYSVFCKIQFTGGKLSICGVEGPTVGGNCIGGCGQIDMHLKASDLSPAPGWTRATIERFLAIWKRWHLNDMRAGTPAQMAHLETLACQKLDYYRWAVAELEKVSLQPDNGYSYGSAWLREEVPADVLAELQALPDTDKKPAWV